MKTAGDHKSHILSHKGKKAIFEINVLSRMQLDVCRKFSGKASPRQQSCHSVLELHQRSDLFLSFPHLN